MSKIKIMVQQSEKATVKKQLSQQANMFGNILFYARKNHVKPEHQNNSKSEFMVASTSQLLELCEKMFDWSTNLCFHNDNQISIVNHIFDNDQIHIKFVIEGCPNTFVCKLTLSDYFFALCRRTYKVTDYCDRSETVCIENYDERLSFERAFDVHQDSNQEFELISTACEYYVLLQIKSPQGLNNHISTI